MIFAGVNGTNSDYTNLINYMSLDSFGNLGIGTITPGYKLDVVGDINFTGTLRSNGTPFTVAQPTG